MFQNDVLLDLKDITQLARVGLGPQMGSGCAFDQLRRHSQGVSLLNGVPTPDSIQWAGELHQKAIASGFECAPAMLRSGRINNFFANGPQLAVGARLIRLHQSGL